MRKVKLVYKQLKYLFVAPLLASCTVTPEPFTTEEIKSIALSDRALIFSSQESLANTGPLTLEKAFAMALKYNLENRVLLLEESLSNEAFDMARFDMMPALAANAGYTDRSNLNASFSNSIETGQVSLVPSSSQELQQTTSDISFTWNLLDFGVSYLAAKQSADNYLIAKKTREKVMLTLLQEVRSAYWYAIAMKEMEDEFDDLYKTSEETYNNLIQAREDGSGNPVAVLTEIRAMIETIQVLDQVRQSISTSRTRLATLINVYGLENIELEVPESFPKLFRISDDAETMELMEQTALINSVDYLTEIYNVRIEHEETRKSLLQMLPGLEFSYGENYSSNKFYLNEQWGQLGLNLTGDIMRLFNASTIRKFRETSEQVTIGRKLAVNMATVAGVNITWQDYQNSGIAYERAFVLDEVEAELFTITQNQADVEMSVLGQSGFENLERTGEQVPVIQGKLRAFMTKIQKLESYAAAQTSAGSYMTSLGINPIPENYQDYSVDALGKHIEDGFFTELQPFMALNAIDDQSVVYEENVKVVGNVLSNDILKNTSSLTLVEGSKGEDFILGVTFTTEKGGSLLINTDGSYVYSLPTNLFGTDLNLEFKEEFIYTVTGADGDLDTATLSIVSMPGFAPAEEIETKGPNLDEYLNMDGEYILSLQTESDSDIEVLEENNSEQGASVEPAPELDQYLSNDSESFISLETDVEQNDSEQEALMEPAPQLDEYLNNDRENFASLQTEGDSDVEVLEQNSSEQEVLMEPAPRLDQYLSNDRESLTGLEARETGVIGVIEISSPPPRVVEFQESFGLN